MFFANVTLGDMAGNHRAIESAATTYEKRKKRSATYLRLVPPPAQAAELRRRAQRRHRLVQFATFAAMVGLVVVFAIAG